MLCVQNWFVNHHLQSTAKNIADSNSSWSIMTFKSIEIQSIFANIRFHSHVLLAAAACQNNFIVYSSSNTHTLSDCSIST